MKRLKEMQKLDNPCRNLCLDKGYGESKIDLGEWINFSIYEEK